LFAEEANGFLQIELEDAFPAALLLNKFYFGSGFFPSNSILGLLKSKLLPAEDIFCLISEIYFCCWA